MNVLFVYKYLTLGGVEAVLRTRLDGLSDFGINAHAWFLSYVDGQSILDPADPRVWIGDVEHFQAHLQENEYSLVSSIDTEEIFPVMIEQPSELKFIIEAHSPYRGNLEYLRHAGDVPIAAMLVPSKFQREFIRPYLASPMPTYVVPNPLLAQFTSDLSNFVPRPERPILAWIGRLDDLKNWKDFFRLAEKLCVLHGNLQIWVAGRALSRATGRELYQAAKKHSLLPRLRWFMNLPYSSVPSFLDAVRCSGGIVVSTSKGESFGMTIAEAMARGCAVAVPSYGPFPEFVEDGVSGCLYKAGSVFDAVEKANTLISDSRLRDSYGQKARETILEAHQAERALATLARCLEDIIAD